MTQLSKMDFRNQTNYNSTSNVEIKRRNNRTKRNLISRKYRIRKKKSSRYNLIFFLQELRVFIANRGSVDLFKANRRYITAIKHNISSRVSSNESFIKSRDPSATIFSRRKTRLNVFHRQLLSRRDARSAACSPRGVDPTLDTIKSSSGIPWILV